MLWPGVLFGKEVDVTPTKNLEGGGSSWRRGPGLKQATVGSLQA